jgi:hypothetical protein
VRLTLRGNWGDGGGRLRYVASYASALLLLRVQGSLLGFQRLDQPIDRFKGQLIGNSPNKLAIVSDPVI